MDKCSNQKEIDLMSKALYGNGRAGLIETTAHISTKVGHNEYDKNKTCPNFSVEDVINR